MRVALTIAISAILLTGSASPLFAAGGPLLTVGVDVIGANSRRATYSLVVTNRGEGRARSVLLSAAVPEQTGFLRSSPRPSSRSGAPACNNRGEIEPAGALCEWNLGNLKPGTSRSVIVVLELSRGGSGYQVALEATTGAIDAGAGGEAIDTDDSLRVTVLAPGQPAGTVVHDTWTDRNEAADTNHGACSGLRVAAGGATTTFIRFSPLPAESVLGLVHAATLEATVTGTTYSEGAARSLSVHALSGDAWTQGSGGCEPGSTGSGTELRNGVLPTIAVDATSVATVEGPGLLTWDVSTDLLDEQQRASSVGWAVVDREETEAATELAASETTVEEGEVDGRPHLVFVHELAEAATCIDLAPEGAARRNTRAQMFTAYATDGIKVAAEGSEACSGAPIPEQEIEWDIEDDDPDAYIARIFKDPTSGEPNAAVTQARGSGVVRLFLRLSDPQAAPDGSDTRISARLAGAADPDTRALTDICHLGLPLIQPCASESELEDDAILTWSAGAR